MRLALSVALILLAFVLGMLGERWLHGAERERALREYERAADGYASGQRLGAPPPGPR